MNIKGLNMTEISQKLDPYIEGFFKGSKLATDKNGMFAESYLLGFDEIKWLLPEEYYLVLGGNEKFYNGASGVLEFTEKAEQIEGLEYTVMLLSDEAYSNALILFLEATNIESGSVEIKVVKDFLSVDEGSDNQC